MAKQLKPSEGAEILRRGTRRPSLAGEVTLTGPRASAQGGAPAAGGRSCWLSSEVPAVALDHRGDDLDGPTTARR